MTGRYSSRETRGSLVQKVICYNVIQRKKLGKSELHNTFMYKTIRPTQQQVYVLFKMLKLSSITGVWNSPLHVNVYSDCDIWHYGNVWGRGQPWGWYDKYVMRNVIRQRHHSTHARPSKNNMSPAKMSFVIVAELGMRPKKVSLLNVSFSAATATDNETETCFCLN